MPTRVLSGVRRPVDALANLESYNSIKASARIISARKLLVKRLADVNPSEVGSVSATLLPKLCSKGMNTSVAGQSSGKLFQQKSWAVRRSTENGDELERFV